MSSPYFPKQKSPAESLTHAVNRMKAQGYSDSQIRGQVKRWHRDWSDQQVASHIVANAKQGRASFNEAVSAAKTEGLPVKGGTSFVHDASGVAKGLYSVGKTAVAPAYEDIRHGPNSPQAKKARTNQMAVGEAVGKSLVHPFTDLPSAIASGSPGRVVSDLGNIGLNFAPVGKAAGILGGLRGLKKVKDAQEAAKVVEGAKEISPAEQVRGTLKGARSVRGKQEAGYSAERTKRFTAASQHLSNAALDPAERLRLAEGELAGELPKVNYQGMMRVLDEHTVSQLQSQILDHPHLMPGQKIRASKALTNALTGKVPTNSELTLLEHVFGKDTAAGLGQVHKYPLWNLSLSTLNVPRSIMAAFDLSAPFRQGLVVSTRHPAIFAKNFKPMVKAFGSEKVYQSILEDIHTRPSYPMMMQAKLAITELGKAVGGREEHFASDVAEHIPIAGRGIRASGRAYTGFLDKTRADVFDHLIKRAQGQGINVQDEKFLKGLGSYINSATGRGDLGHFQEAGKVLNTFFFSPRLLASRLNFMNPVYYARLDPFARKEALRAAIQLSGTLSVLLGLASQIPGVKVVADPRNPDWGKIKHGNTRIDIAGGFQQPLRLFAQLATGTAISSTTGKKLNLTTSGFGKPTRLDLFLRFWEGKEAPWASFVTDYLRNSDQVGNKFSWNKEAYGHLTPLLAQDTYDLYKSQHGGMNGIAAAFAGYGVGGLGFGLQTYGPKVKAPKNTGVSPYFGGSESGSSSPYFSSP